MWRPYGRGYEHKGARPSTGAGPHVLDAGGLEGRVPPRPDWDAVERVPPADGVEAVPPRALTMEGRVPPRPILDAVEGVPPMETKSVLEHSIPKPLGQYRT